MKDHSLNQNKELGEDVVLRVEHLSKKFCRTLKRSMFYGTIDIARSMMGIGYETGNLRKAEFWALDDVSFELRRGETLGIIGVNGSGKSTLLRLISGIFPPDKGSISFKGRIGALIAVGAGFHPYMTGRENIYLNGTILGMTRKEIDQKIDEIIDFAEIGEFLEAPVNVYSSGMRVRLGFSIAVHCDPDILLVDEVLSVGDLSFRNKSLRKMDEFRKKANALIFISHNLEQIRVLCDRVIILDQGKVLFNGDTDEGLIKYENLSKDSRVASINAYIDKRSVFRTLRSDGERLTLDDFGVVNKNNVKVNKIGTNDELRIFFDLALNEELEEIYFTVAVVNETKNVDCIWIKSNDYSRYSFKNLKTGKYRVLVIIPEHHLGPGVYFLNIAARSAISNEEFFHARTNVAFSVKSINHLERGIILSENTWNLENK